MVRVKRVTTQGLASQLGIAWFATGKEKGLVIPPWVPIAAGILLGLIVLALRLTMI